MNFEMDNQYIGKRLRELRKQKKIQAVQMAEYLSCSRNQLSLIERGISSVSVDKFLKICTLLGESPDNVLGIPKGEATELEKELFTVVDKLTEKQQILLKDFLHSLN